MRYQDILDEYPKSDPLMTNITTAEPNVIGVFIQNSKIYIKVNDERRIAVDTNDCGKLEYELENLSVGDVVLFEMKDGSKYTTFWEEKNNESKSLFSDRFFF
ncbi:hypothetical protein [Listeria fleischmannii]|uniref:Uncharacterized protein n=1 Tax=Listeria fleischmannii FSL S10-1203 TaxID=1265822 RepID=W7DND6_9LIST|nr:hypothetical protein [Listeria fleischmannii]EUJ56625.1 hypothetical protein MCOL2_08866 [Listeria fleischmannii FSL S10-1203]